MRSSKLFALYTAISAASLWLRSAVPAMALSGATHDDFLFVRQAYYLGAGAWLGPFDNLTLAKGMGYPAFILAAFLSGLPLKLAEHVVYLAAAGIAAWIVVRMARSRLLGLIVFAVLAFNPLLWHEQLARVIREGLYGSLSLAVVALMAGAVLGYHWGWRFLPHRLALFVAAGLIGGVYWLTREEGVWLAPALAVLLGAVCLDAFTRWRNGARRAALRLTAITAVGVAAAGLVAAGIVGSVAAANRASYGIFASNEFHGSAFPAAYGALSRIRHDAWSRHVVFPRDARDKAYAVSAAVRELRPSLDGEHGELWREIGCAQTQTSPCPEILSGWFMWALRDAVAAAGHYASGRDADAFYWRLAGEINAACDDGRLPCLPFRATMAPPFRWHYVTDALALVPALLRVLVGVGNAKVGASPSSGLEFYIEHMAELVGPVSRPFTSVVAIVGWIEVKDALPAIFVRDRAVTAFQSQLIIRPLDNVPAGSPDRRLVEFELTADCRRPSCDFVVKSGSDEQIVQLTALAAGSRLQTADYDLSIRAILERGEGTHKAFAAQKLRRLQLSIASMIARTYATIIPVLAALALIGFVATAVLQRAHRFPPGILTLTAVCAAAVAARIALLAYLDVTSIWSVNLLYLSPATPFLLCLVVLGIYCGVIVLRGLVTSRRVPVPSSPD